MKDELTLSAPSHLLKIAIVYQSVSLDSMRLRIGVMPSDADAELPDAFSCADVFPIEQIDRFYKPYGSPIYEVGMNSFDHERRELKLYLSDAWRERAYRETYDREPFLLDLNAHPRLLSRVRQFHDFDSTWIRASTPAPLCQDTLPSSWAAWRYTAPPEGLLARPAKPLYQILSLDENGTVTVQLDPRWLKHRQEVLIPRSRAAAAFLDEFVKA
jgi:hypothetical protein